ncbi:MAG: DUF177 domain-containing protein [Pseudomonadota bacterium]
MQHVQNISIGDAIKPADIRFKDGIAFEAALTADEIADLIDKLGVRALSKLRFQGEFLPHSDGSILLRGQLGASVGQNCIITLQPMTTRIDTKFERQFVALSKHDDPEAEIELLDDDPEDILPNRFVLFDILTEALALEIPEYPRASGAALEDAQFTEPGKKPMTDEDARPFASLSALRDKLNDDN